MSASICINGTLAPYIPSAIKPWDRARALHVLRRLGQSASFDNVSAALAMSPSDFIDQLVDQAINIPLSAPPAWENWTIDQFGDFDTMFMRFDEWRDTLVKDLKENGLREKLTLFWHNHFVTQVEGYVFAPYGYIYRKTLQEYSMGNFKDFVAAIGKTQAMLAYLSGGLSTKDAPNENYARELFELFTMGQDNGYTQQDITETARALTGWTVPNFQLGNAPTAFIPQIHDDGIKTIFDQTGNWGYDDVINLIFTERSAEVANFIVSKLYRFFVNQQEDEAVISELAQDFINSNFAIEPVLRKLFKSEHFFDDAVFATQVKSPLEMELNFLNEMNLDDPSLYQFIKFGAIILGQELLNPPDVAGWQGHHEWIDATKLTNRWQVLDYFLFYLYENQPELLRTFAKDLSGNSNDPDYISQVIVDHFFPRGLQQAFEYERVSIIFRGEIPQNYYDDGSWNLDWDEAPIQVAFLIYSLFRMPEFQLY